jgi:preprotein translocase subunit SecD
VTPASVTRGGQGAGQTVVVEFDKAGASTLSDVTGKAIDKQLAALLNGKVLSAPTVKSAITTGKVTFAFGTASEAERVAAELGASPTS